MLGYVYPSVSLLNTGVVPQCEDLRVRVSTWLGMDILITKTWNGLWATLPSSVEQKSNTMSISHPRNDITQGCVYRMWESQGATEGRRK